MYFSTFEAVKILGIKRDKLRDLLDRGFIKSTFQEDLGDRKKSMFDRWTLYEIKLFLFLVDKGFSRKRAGEWIKKFRSLSGTRTDHDGYVTTVKGKKFINPSKEQNPVIAQAQNMAIKEEHAPDLVVILENKDEMWRTDQAFPYKIEINSNEPDFDQITIINFAKIRRQVDNEINKG